MTPSAVRCARKPPTGRCCRLRDPKLPEDAECEANAATGRCRAVTKAPRKRATKATTATRATKAKAPKAKAPKAKVSEAKAPKAKASEAKATKAKAPKAKVSEAKASEAPLPIPLLQRVRKAVGTLSKAVIGGALAELERDPTVGRAARLVDPALFPPEPEAGKFSRSDARALRADILAAGRASD